ncbi:MAG TPA: glycosyltransferase family 2 protein [Bacteroidetes bacterium]|nr:glycosyltransferase family 2 protein [Bacteroidota bacterium]
MKPLLSVVVPAYNEENTIRTLLGKVISSNPGLEMEIIVVNDGSADKTGSKVEDFIREHPEAPVRLISHATNQGKGAALHTGIAEACGEYLVIQDADLEYNPVEYGLLLKPVVEGVADVVYGSRFMGSKPHRILFFWHTVGNRVLTFLSNAFTNLNLTDMETCYKLFRTEIIQRLDLREKKFGFEPEVTAKIARVPGIRIYEVGISYYGRTYAEGKKINWKDGFRAMYCILKYNLFHRKVMKS